MAVVYRHEIHRMQRRLPTLWWLMSVRSHDKYVNSEWNATCSQMKTMGHELKLLLYLYHVIMVQCDTKASVECWSLNPSGYYWISRRSCLWMCPSVGQEKNIFYLIFHLMFSLASLKIILLSAYTITLPDIWLKKKSRMKWVR